MRIQTGKGTTIPLITLIAIWSISAIISLPGLAISPILGDLKKIFPDTSDIEIQMLTSLPSLLIIPFVLLSGRLSVNKNKLRILLTGMIIFFISGILYFFSNSMLYLIIVSCLLGVGAGMVIPLSTGLIADYFSGNYRVKQLGISSSISNLALVIVTFLTGYLADLNWHYPFLVYLLPIFAIFLSYYLKDKSESNPEIKKEKIETQSTDNIPHKINYPQLIGLMLFYFVITYLVLIIPLNLSFIMQEYKMDSSVSGTMIAIFFLAIMLPGFFINKIIRQFKENTIIISTLLIVAGLGVILLSHKESIIALGCLLSGFGYGVIQPIIYEKTTYTSATETVTLALAFVMSVNYLAILVCPMIIDSFLAIFHTQSQTAPFFINLILSAIFLCITIIRKKSFVLGIDKNFDA